MTDRQQIDAEMERDIEALGLTAPRVTPDQIDAELGAKYAIKDAEAKARQELWKLEGWRLKCHLEEMSGPRVGGATNP